MAENGQLELRIGWRSEAGRRPENEDYVGAWLGTALRRARQGVVAVIADGVSGAPAGRDAAEVSARAFIDFYLGQGEAAGIRRAAAHAAETVNRWVHAQGRADPLRLGMATTLTAIILRGRQAHILHVGDTRAYRLRDGQLHRLTRDHVDERPERGHILLRAIGLEDTVRADYLAEPLRVGDRLILMTDGVHGALRERDILDLAAEATSADATAHQLVHAALAAGSQDNATALVADIVALPAEDHDALASVAASLPILDLPKPGDNIDGYAIGDPLSDGRYSRLYLGTDGTDNQPVVLKFPKPLVAADTTYRQSFVREGWVAARVRSPWLGEVLEPAPGRQTRLYTVMPHYRGRTLEDRVRRGPPVSLAEGVAIAGKLAKAVTSLHRARVIHRDIKPDNVMLLEDGGVRLIDLGVVRLPGLEDFPAETIPGTPSYMAPELLAGGPGDERSDLYALGVTIYRMFTGDYPYGEIEPFQRPRFGTPVPVQQRRPDLPATIDPVLARAVAVAPIDRQGDVMELALDLEAAAIRPGPAIRERRPLYERNPLRFWQGIALVLLVALILSLAR